jgi:hypothetical protein
MITARSLERDVPVFAANLRRPQLSTPFLFNEKIQRFRKVFLSVSLTTVFS